MYGATVPSVEVLTSSGIKNYFRKIEILRSWETIIHGSNLHSNRSVSIILSTEEYITLRYEYTFWVFLLINKERLCQGIIPTNNRFTVACLSNVSSCSNFSIDSSINEFVFKKFLLFNFAF